MSFSALHFRSGCIFRAAFPQLLHFPTTSRRPDLLDDGPEDLDRRVAGAVLVNFMINADEQPDDVKIDIIHNDRFIFFITGL